MYAKKWEIQVVALCLCLGVGSACLGKVIYVDDDATGAKNGSSWTDAYRYLQDALADANAAEKPVEIRVAQGTYRPDEDTLHPDGTGDRKASFELINGMTLQGGYAGLDEPDPNARDTGLYETILSGDLDGNDIEVTEGSWWELSEESTRAENSYHVVTGNDIDNAVSLDGFTIRAGNANEEWSSKYHINGGGMTCLNVSALLTNCIFAANSAKHEGGGLYDVSGDLQLDSCTFNGNWAGWDGGGMQTYYGTPTMTNCRFIGNRGNGGMCNIEGAPQLANCVFSGNQTAYCGGAISNYSHVPLVLLNCTLAGNSAALYGGGVYTAQDEEDYEINLIMKNCILWGNVPSPIDVYGRPPTVTYSDIQGGWIGEGNIDVNPSFVASGHWDPNGTVEDTSDDFWVDGDYHLKSQAGRWDPKLRSWVLDDVTSPCIDAGDPASPIGDEPFPNGGRINMGAYGGTAEASKSYFGGPPCE
ncbi:MAG: hypothetical protein JXN61_12305, partial [Sedimentisphaerales bacterium]|nr:hypothetical protein [Sedimentisphaerales bacterium]